MQSEWMDSRFLVIILVVSLDAFKAERDSACFTTKSCLSSLRR